MNTRQAIAASNGAARILPRPPDIEMPFASCRDDVDGLLLKSSAGNEEAFADLYDATSARAYGLARRILRNPAHAEEVAQEAFLEVWRKAGRFDPERGSAIAWILVIVHRRSVDRVRSEQARTRREAIYQRHNHADQQFMHDHTGDMALALLGAEHVTHALSSLPAAQRVALELTYFNGCTNTQLAALTGVSLGTAKSRIRAGLIRLRTQVPQR